MSKLIRCSRESARAVPPPRVHSCPAGSASRAGSTRSSSARHCEPCHLLDPLDCVNLLHSPHGRGPFELRECNAAVEDDVVDYLDRQLLEKGSNMGAPARQTALRSQAPEQRILVDAARPGSIYFAQREVESAHR